MPRAKFTLRMPTDPIEAIQFTGGLESAKEILEWLGENGVFAQWVETVVVATPEDDIADLEVPEQIRIFENEDSPTWSTLEVGWWMIHDTDTEFYGVPDEDFQQAFEKVLEGKLDIIASEREKDTFRVTSLLVDLGDGTQAEFLRLRHAGE